MGLGAVLVAGAPRDRSQVPTAGPPGAFRSPPPLGLFSLPRPVMSLPDPGVANEPLPAIGPLRDFPSTSAGPTPTAPRISDYNNAKIRNLCFLLSVMVVFNHAITAGDLRDWQGEHIVGAQAEDLAVRPIEFVVEHFLSGSLGRITNPVFFAVSGYLFFWAWRPDWTSLRRKWRRRAFSLLVPLVVWAGLGKAVWLLDHLWSNRHALRIMVPAGEWGFAELGLTFLGMNVPSQLWFIDQLLWLMVLVAPLLAWGLPRIRWWALVPLAVLYFLPAPDPLFIFRKGPLCFFCLGALLGREAAALDLPSRRWTWGAAAIWVAAAVGFTALAVFSSTPSPIAFKALVLVGVAGAWSAYDLLPHRFHRALDVVAPYRFFVYMGFDPVLPILQRHFLGWFDSGQTARLAAYVLFPSVVVTGIILLAWALHRVAPGVYFIITGGRSPLPREGVSRVSAGSA